MSSRSAKKKADGGKVMPYNAQGSNEEKEAEEKNKGGAVKRARGGMVAEMEGAKSRHRLDKRGRARGGSVGADMHPLSSAAGEVGGREPPTGGGMNPKDVTGE